MTPDQMQRLEEAVQRTHEKLLTMANGLNRLVDHTLALERALDALKTAVSRPDSEAKAMMPRQLSLFDIRPLVELAYQECESIREWFDRFHARNPHVHRMLRDRTLETRRRTAAPVHVVF